MSKDAGLLNIHNELQVQEFKQLKAGDLFLLPEKGADALALRVDIPHVTNEWPAVRLTGDSPFRCVLYSPSFDIHCLVLGKATWRVPADMSGPTFTGNQKMDVPGVIAIANKIGGYLRVQTDGGTALVNLTNFNIVGVVAPRWYATTWVLGIENSGGEFTSLLTWSTT
jgi:hypothetical protein